jgi:histidinol phosphatase-like enzyme
MPFLGSLRELDPICRKPKPGLFVELADRFSACSRHSWASFRNLCASVSVMTLK